MKVSIMDTYNKLNILCRAMGLTQYGQRTGNRYVTNKRSDMAVCSTLVSEGLMSEVQRSALTSRRKVFRVTANGVYYVARCTTKQSNPNERCFTFPEWLGSKLRHS